MTAVATSLLHGRPFGWAAAAAIRRQRLYGGGGGLATRQRLSGGSRVRHRSASQPPVKVTCRPDRRRPPPSAGPCLRGHFQNCLIGRAAPISSRRRPDPGAALRSSRSGALSLADSLASGLLGQPSWLWPRRAGVFGSTLSFVRVMTAAGCGWWEVRDGWEGVGRGGNEQRR